MILLSALLLAVGAGVPLAAQESLSVVDSLALAGRADEARTVLESWWENDRARSNRRDRQRGLWLRAVLTVDPRMARLDYQRLVLEYPGGSHSDEAMLRLGLISAAAEDLPRAAGYFRTLLTDYPGSPLRRQAEDWLSEHSVAVERADAAARRVELADEEVEPTALPEAAADPDAQRDAQDVVVDPQELTGRLLPRYGVQVGAFESEERARSLLAAVTASGFRARIVRVPGSDLVRVRVGSFPDQTGAVELMDRVRRRGHEATIALDVAEEEPVP